MKNFACLILGMGLLVNATMANLNENDAIDRVKRGSLNFQVKYRSISATKKSFIEAQIKTLYNKLVDGGNQGKIAETLRIGLENEFEGSRWIVLICEKDGICSLSKGTLYGIEYLHGFYGQTGWYIFGIPHF